MNQTKLIEDVTNINGGLPRYDFRRKWMQLRHIQFTQVLFHQALLGHFFCLQRKLELSNEIKFKPWILSTHTHTYTRLGNLQQLMHLPACQESRSEEENYIRFYTSTHI